jgi:ferritin-like metal-binding protein YciE
MEEEIGRALFSEKRAAETTYLKKEERKKIRETEKNFHRLASFVGGGGRRKR